MKKLLLILLCLPLIGFGQNVNIPDANFKAYLLANTAINTNGDSEIQVSEASSFSDSINCSSMSIYDLTGIEYFTSLTYLNCMYNFITSLDLSNNTALKHLNCYWNSLNNLDVSSNTSLIYLRCDYTNLTSLDVSNNTALTYLKCGWNQLTSLDVSNLVNLTELWCEVNQLPGILLTNNIHLKKIVCNTNQFTDLDVTNNLALNYLDVAWNYIITIDLSQNTLLDTLELLDNQLSSIDVSNNTSLSFLDVRQNNLSNLNISNNLDLAHLQCGENFLNNIDVSSNTSLELLWCNNNYLTSLDLSNNVALRELDCKDNQLTSLDLRNGNNSNMSFMAYQGFLIHPISTTGNSSLFCMDVDDPAYSIANWTMLNPNNWVLRVDTFTSFSTNCATAIFGCTNPTALNYDPMANSPDGSCIFEQTYIPDYYFESALIDLGYDTYFDDSVSTPRIDTIITLNIDSANISDLTGIEDFLALTHLSCSNNQLTNLDLSLNTSLVSLNCNNNSLISLDLRNGNNTNFSLFDATNNLNLTCINVDNAAWSTSNWILIDPAHYFSTNCSLSGVEDFIGNKDILKFKDLLGRDIENRTNELLFRIYDNGKVEKTIIIE